MKLFNTSTIGKLRISGVINSKTYQKLQRDISKLPSTPPTALAVVINSPGGSAVHSDLIFKRLRCFSSQHKVPILTFAEDLAASGGYYIMCAGDNLYTTSPLALIGSIGAVASFYNIKSLADRFGVERRHWSTAPMDIISVVDGLQDYTTEKSKIIKAFLKETNQEFRSVVIQRRGEKLKIPAEKREEELFNGDVWGGMKALELGLVDEVGRCEEVIKEKFPKARVLDLSVEKKFDKIIRIFEDLGN